MFYYKSIEEFKNFIEDVKMGKGNKKKITKKLTNYYGMITDTNMLCKGIKAPGSEEIIISCVRK